MITSAAKHSRERPRKLARHGVRSTAIDARLRLFVVIPLIGCATVLDGCAFSGAVSQESVEYNKAAADMANQLTLLNVVRAKDHMPIFYTSIARLTGSLQVTASGGLNAQFKTPAPTNTTSSTTATTSGTNTTTANGSSTAPSVTTTTYDANGTATGSSTNPGGTTSTTSSTTGPISSAGTVVTNLMSHAVTSGGTLYSPTVGGQVVGGPSFDIQILDTQQFYQGVLQEIPFSTIETFIDQGVDDKLLMRLLIERVEFRLSDDLKNDAGVVTRHAGDLVRVLYNAASDKPIAASAELSSYPKDSSEPSTAFVTFVECHRLQGRIERKPKKPLAPASRLRDDSGRGGRVSIKDLTLLDGEKFDLALQEKNESQPAGVPDDLEKGFKWDKHGYVGENDDKVFVVRLASEKRAPETPLTCAEDASPDLPTLFSERAHSGASPAKPERTASSEVADTSAAEKARQAKEEAKQAELLKYATDLLHLKIEAFTPQNSENGKSFGASASAKLKVDGKEDVPADVSFIFRSPEGLIRFLGRYLEELEANPELVRAVDRSGVPLFTVDKNGAPLLFPDTKDQSRSLVATRLIKTDYAIPDDVNRRENMQILGLVEEIINLQKSSADRPATVPVHVLP